MTWRTPDEAWSVARPRDHWYVPTSEFALRSLGLGTGKCLVIGSPLFEASELADAGWAVTYLDVRKAPADDQRVTFLRHDACELPFSDATFDAVSTSCVLCHAGMGRYGEDERPGADVLILGEIGRVLKPAGRAAVTFGPVGDVAGADASHRIYTLADARRMVAVAGMIEEAHDITGGHALDYLSMLLRRI